MKDRCFAKVAVGILAVTLTAGMNPGKLQAAENASTTSVALQVKNINLNIQQADGSYKIAGIHDPFVPTFDFDNIDISAPRSGSKVYYGSYKGNPLLFRVLDADTTKYNPEHTMLLDCDTIVENIRFYPDDCNNVWAESYLKTWMNSTAEDGFVNCDDAEIPGMLHTFTTQEQNSIALSTKETEDGSDGYGWPLYLKWCPLSEDKVFALDAKEATYSGYGYLETNSHGENRKKSVGKGYCWWLRTGDFVDNYCVGVVDLDGRVRHSRVAGNVAWASPAFNLNLSSVLMSSACGINKSSELSAVGMSGESADIWELTLLDRDKTVSVAEGKKVTNEKGIITVPFTYTGSDVNQISVMITDRAYDSEGAEVLYYGKLNTQVSFTDNKAASGTFTLPGGLPDTADIYILAEDINGDNATDYASAPVMIGDMQSMNETDYIENVSNGENPASEGVPKSVLVIGLCVLICCIGAGTCVAIHTILSRKGKS